MFCKIKEVFSGELLHIDKVEFNSFLDNEIFFFFYIILVIGSEMVVLLSGECRVDKE
jgi:hypothetical protein